MDDRVLMDQVRNGNEAAFEMIFRAHFPWGAPPDASRMSFAFFHRPWPNATVDPSAPLTRRA